MDKVLVMLSTYNGERFLRQQLDSLLTQKEVSVEILARDDGSKDGTLDILNEYAGNNAITVLAESNRGAAESFLHLLELAPAGYDYYAFCDQDDFWKEDKLYSAVSQLSIADQTKPALYYSGQILTDENLNLLHYHDLNTNRSVYANFVFNQMAGCTAVFNGALLQQLKRFHPKGIYGHDVWCYKVCAALDGAIFVESRGHILYRQHGNNVVGLKKGLRGQIQNAKKYIFKYRPSSYASQLLDAYGSELSDEWQKFVDAVKRANTDAASRRRLLRNPQIKFNSTTLRLIFILKVLLRKM